MPAELATSLTVTDDDLLMQAEQQVRDYCGWHIAPPRTEVLTLDGSSTSVMLLPTLHLTDLTAATEDGVDVDLTTLEWSEAGIVRRWCAWTSKFRGVTVNITHGYANVPADVAGVVRDIATRAKSNGGGLKAKSVGPFSETYATDLLSTERAILDRYKLPPRP